MKKYFVFLFLALIIVSSAFVFAAGSGGGGVIKRAKTDSAASVENEEDNSAKDVTVKDAEEMGKIIDVRAKDLKEKQGLKCGDLDATKERVKCRLKLSDDAYNEENKLSYLPEECRAITDEEKQNKCIEIYKKTQRCWSFQIGEGRIKCVKENLGLIRSHREEKVECRKLDGEERGKCISNLKEKSYDLVKFRFYDLEERAEKLKEKGLANEDDVVELIAALEEKKIEFNNTTTINDKKRIILEVRQLWKDFVLKIKEKRVENEQTA